MIGKIIKLVMLVSIVVLILSGCSSAAIVEEQEATSTPIVSIPPAMDPSVTPVVPLIDTPLVSTATDSPATFLSLPAEDEASARLSVPNGFAIRIFAQGLQGKPRFMSFGPDNSLYISMTNGGSIMRLPDVNQDGLVDSNEVVISSLNQPHGLEWQGDWLYVAENDRVERFRYSMETGLFDARELVTDNIPGGVGHYTRTLHFGPDGKLYVSAGSS
ncbi:MAG: hypothetical protein CVU45_04620, partial [Chloroflexi bacterium HGW-Chloroflexi-7]